MICDTVPTTPLLGLTHTPIIHCLVVVFSVGLVDSWCGSPFAAHTHTHTHCVMAFFLVLVPLHTRLPVAAVTAAKLFVLDDSGVLYAHRPYSYNDS